MYPTETHTPKFSKIQTGKSKATARRTARSKSASEPTGSSFANNPLSEILGNHGKTVL